jgi:hypothetical protein
MDKEQDKIQMLCRQTNYTQEEAKEKLIEFDQDIVKVIKNYLGIKEKVEPIKSINQEIYKQFRQKMNDSMKDYNKEQEEKLRAEIEKNNEI